MSGWYAAAVVRLRRMVVAGWLLGAVALTVWLLNHHEVPRAA